MNVKDGCGLSLVSFALEKNVPEVVRILVDAGAEISSSVYPPEKPSIGARTKEFLFFSFGTQLSL